MVRNWMKIDMFLYITFTWLKQHYKVSYTVLIYQWYQNFASYKTWTTGKQTTARGKLDHMFSWYFLLSVVQINQLIGPWGFEWNFRCSFMLILVIADWDTSCEIASDECCWTLLDIGSGNGLVSSGNTPLPASMLTQLCGAIWRLLATMS